MPIALLVLLVLLSACTGKVGSPTVQESIDAPGQESVPSATKQPVRASLSLLVEGQEGALYSEFFELAEGTILLDLMKRLGDEGKITMEINGEGETAFVQSLNGNAGDPATNRYWLLYVNNELAKAGAGSYTVQDGDAIEWRYMDTSKIEL